MIKLRQCSCLIVDRLSQLECQSIEPKRLRGEPRQVDSFGSGATASSILPTNYRQTSVVRNQLSGRQDILCALFFVFTWYVRSTRGRGGVSLAHPSTQGGGGQGPPHVCIWKKNSFQFRIFPRPYLQPSTVCTDKPFTDLTDCTD